MLQTLEQKIELYKQWKEAYYLGEPIVSDEEFDLLEEELIEMGYDPIVGLAIETLSDKKVTHMNKMLSLGKEKVLSDKMSIEQATYLFNRYSRLGKCVLSWKYDGLAMCAKYINGQFETLATRGNGDIGQNRTEKFKHLVPMLLDKEWSGEIRFEMVINQRLFETNYSDAYTHSRSLVAGICNDINLDDNRKHHVELICLDAVSEDGFIVHPQQLSTQFMKTFKEAYTCCSPEQLQHEFNRAVTRRAEFDYGTDGVVISQWFDEDYIVKFRHNGHHPEHAIAVKFKPPQLVSTVTEIEWKLQKTGKLVPIIHFKPITVDGRLIKQASGHNIEYLVKHDIVPGKTVQVILANDIIPQVKMQ